MVKIKTDSIVTFAVALLVVIPLAYGAMWLMTISTQYVVKELFEKDIPYWPTFVAWLVLGWIGKALRGNGENK